jgi:hypothetical protein
MHSGRIGRMVQKNLAEVFAQGASGAFAAAVDFAFLSAGFAGEVAGNSGAGQADRLRVGAVSSAG